MEIGPEIRRRRKTAGLSLRRLAQMAQVNAAYLSRVERGEVSPSYSLLLALGDALGNQAEELLLLAGRVPESWRQVITERPGQAIQALRNALTSVQPPLHDTEGTNHLWSDPRAIEDSGFPFDELCDVAELESWRKEVNRPVYHLHKWWAQRLGSVFRAILLGTFMPKGSDIADLFYQPSQLGQVVVFDPFMGSGTTIGETLKLGARAIGRDINPVAYFAVRNALGPHSRGEVTSTFDAIEREVASKIKHYYQARLPSGKPAEVLYFFWVKHIPCPNCERSIDLFSSFVFAQHAYPSRTPEARTLCPSCGAVILSRYDADNVTCPQCGCGFDPHAGPVRGAKATCSDCDHTFSIVKALQQRGQRPSHRLYAKMVLRDDGTKEYLPADTYDFEMYHQAALALEQRQDNHPMVAIEPGYNTNQALNYGYTFWHEMFNDRQLLCLGLLAERIQAIPSERLRSLFTCLFSGTLEFNNMFASFKGEGTGAVRHMFAHHVLKPERTPLEANLWGTPKSSGSFSTLFKSRLLRLIDYCEDPFEIRVARTDHKRRSEKVYGLSSSLGQDAADTFAEFQAGKQLYLSSGDSSRTDLASASVDAVVTDPPFFDNVHYSQLADFFYVWQRHLRGADDNQMSVSTRSDAEVQNSDAAEFTSRLTAVWEECHRVLRPTGLLVFTYHHSRAEGWRSVLEAVVEAGFRIVATHPIKSEMSVAMPKHQAKEPIDLDVIVVCRKILEAPRLRRSLGQIVNLATEEASQQVSRLNGVARKLSRNDIRVILMAQIIKHLSWQSSLAESLRLLDSNGDSIDDAIELLQQGQRFDAPPPLQGHFSL